jgi:hypothetical protein
MSERPFAKLLLGVAFQTNTTGALIAAAGRVTGAGGKLYIERSDDKSLPTPFDLVCEPGNPGINPHASPHTDATALLDGLDPIGGEIALRDEDTKVELSFQQLDSDGGQLPVGWVACKGRVEGITVSVLGVILAPTSGYVFRLVRAEPQGIVKQTLLLRLEVTAPSGPSAQVITPAVVAYHETRPDHFTNVQIEWGQASVTIPLESEQ